MGDFQRERKQAGWSTQGMEKESLVWSTIHYCQREDFYHFAPFNFEETIKREYLTYLTLNVRKSTAAPTVLTALIAAVSALNTLQESWMCGEKSRKIA